MTFAFDQAAYQNLLAEVAPQVIETEEEYDRALQIAERLIFAKETTPEEDALFKLVVLLIEAYESEHYFFDKPTPHEILQHLIESSGIRQADLVEIIGTSGVVSEVVNGKRSRSAGEAPISKAQAKALGDYFKVSPSMFI